MRRLATLFGGLVMAGALAVTVPGSAWGAQGTLVVNGEEYQDPVGCYSTDTLPLVLVNRTDNTVLVYDAADCRGHVIAALAPGSRSAYEFGASVYVG